MQPSTSSGVKPDNIRNICILAHVDHGKTTIADSLLATNGYISKRSAGQIRYLDDREDEQIRGITMKSSVISLSHVTPEQEKMVVNLVDTPGHIDFSTEVSAAIRICDGALIVVDVIEGVCVQTKEALKQAFEERIRMVLVINKIDRIVVEQQKSVDDVFKQLLVVIEDCNAYLAELCQYDIETTHEDDEHLFSPVLGNVIFASATDGWGVTCEQIAAMFLDKFEGETLETLTEKMWDLDCYVKKGQITKGAIKNVRQNLFTTFFVSTVHYIYTTLKVRLDRSKLPVIVERLKISQQTAAMKSNDAKVQCKAVLQAWMPLDVTLFRQIRANIPAPTAANDKRYDYLVNRRQYFDDYTIGIADAMVAKLNDCSSSDVSIVYISKMFSMNRNLLKQKAVNIVVGKSDRETAKSRIKARAEGEALPEVEPPKVEDTSYTIIALARVFSGGVRVGQDMYVLSPKYRPPPNDVDIDEFLRSSSTIQRVQIEELYILLGKELVPTESVAAGNICGIKGLENYIGRTGTLTSTPFALPLTERNSLDPIVRNSIECNDPKQLPLLRQGLKFLRKIDSCIQVIMQETGELVLVTAGDVHLAKCLEDIKNISPDLDVSVSKPLVTVKETVVSVTKRLDFTKSSPHASECELKEIGATITCSIVPLPDEIVDVVSANYDLLKTVEEFEHAHTHDNKTFFRSDANLQPSIPKRFNADLLDKLKQKLKSSFETSKAPWTDLWCNIWSVGKSRGNVNLLLNNTRDFTRTIFATIDETDARSIFDQCIINAFDSCCRAGPICEEPVSNCAFVISEFKLSDVELLRDADLTVHMVAGIPAAVKECFRNAFQKQLPRLMEPIFFTEVKVVTKVLGKVYSEINRCHGKIIQAIDMDNLAYTVKAYIPVAESYNFTKEIRNATSGEANPNQRFSHYEIIDGDPYYQEEAEPTDDDEESSNVKSKRAANLRLEIRRRKGLKVHDQVVVHAEKQRTLNKKK